VALGVIIGVGIVCIIKSSRVKNVIKKFYQRSPAEFFITLLGGGAMFFILVTSLFELNIPNQSLFLISHTIASAGVTHIITKFSNERIFVEKQKESAIRSYRHSVNIRSKLDYSIRTVDLINTDIIRCSNSSNSKCQLSYNVSRIKDYLIFAKMDSIQNINDWSDTLSDDLNYINDIKDLEEEIKKLSLDKQELNEDDQVEKEVVKKIDLQIDNVKGQIQNLKNKLNPKVRYTLDGEESFEEEYLNYVEQEIISVKARHKKEQLEVSRLQSRNEFDKAPCANEEYSFNTRKIESSRNNIK